MSSLHLLCLTRFLNKTAMFTFAISYMFSLNITQEFLLKPPVLQHLQTQLFIFVTAMPSVIFLLSCNVFLVESSLSLLKFRCLLTPLFRTSPQVLLSVRDVSSPNVLRSVGVSSPCSPWPKENRQESKYRWKNKEMRYKQLAEGKDMRFLFVTQNKCFPVTPVRNTISQVGFPPPKMTHDFFPF